MDLIRSSEPAGCTRWTANAVPAIRAGPALASAFLAGVLVFVFIGSVGFVPHSKLDRLGPRLYTILANDRTLLVQAPARKDGPATLQSRRSTVEAEGGCDTLEETP